MLGGLLDERRKSIMWSLARDFLIDENRQKMRKRTDLKLTNNWHPKISK